MRRRDLLKLLACTAALTHQARADAAWDDQTWTDPARHRSLPLRVRWPAGNGPCALVFFSHGLGGNRSGGALWAEAWRSAGLAVVTVQHPGSDSDSEIWRGGLAALRRGAGLEQSIERVADAHFVLDELERQQRDDPAWQRVRLDAVGFCGHSFGARLTQAVAGETPPAARFAASLRQMRDARPKAFIAFSPGFSAHEGMTDADVAARFGSIERAFLCVTGTKDDAMIVGDATNAARRAVYRGLPPGRKAELCLAGADHMTFAGQATPVARSALLRREAAAAQLEPAHSALVARVTSDWWRWQLLGDEAARAALNAPTGLTGGDTWQQG